MPGNPTDWNIVILGAWNTAILTPEGIASRLFEVPPETPLEVQVPLNGRGPIRVSYDNTLVEPSSNRLVITPAQSTTDALKKSVDVTQCALKCLPETPFFAGGINLRFQFESTPDSLIDAGSSSIDDVLSDNGLTTLEKKLVRTMRWQEGVLNLEVHEREDSTALVLFNFHLKSNSADELSEWFSKFEDMVAKGNDLVSLIAIED